VPSALSHPPPSSAPFIASAQAGPVSFFVRPRSPFSVCLLGERGVRLVRSFVPLFMAKPRQFSAFSFSGIGLSLTHQPSAHGFLPSSRSIQLLNPHSHAITPVFSFWARRHERSLSHKQAQIQARRVLGRLLLWARPNRWFNSDPTCTI